MYYQCAKEFGWTPEQVDEQPVYFLDWILAIHNEALREEKPSDL